ncbi:glycosyltransferase [Kluyvera ascorbata]|uniref:glycosyltransferase n=1 Tax=Kluyvera ascorbata TaxID=51288 RepID=UPI0039F65378
MSSKRILFVITGLGLGGAEKQVCLLADKFAELQYDVKIVALTGEAIILPNHKQIQVICIGMNKNVLSAVKSIFALKRIILSFKPDVVHGHMFHANIFTRIVRSVTRSMTYLVNTAHSKNEGGRVRMLLYRLTDSLCDVTTNVSREALNAFISVGAFKKSKSVTVYNGIDTRLFTFSAEERAKQRKVLIANQSDKLLLAVGRLTKAKDYPTLLRAILQLPDNYKLVIIGEGQERDLIENIIIEYKLSSRVSLIGRHDDVNRFYSACDLFVISSCWEGFGLVVAEAMSCERPVIGTDAGGVREVIGNDSFIVPISSPIELAEKILEVTHFEQKQIVDIGYDNRQHVLRNFDINSIAKQWLGIYKFDS